MGLKSVKLGVTGLNNELAAIVLPQLDELIVKFDELRQRVRGSDWSCIEGEMLSEFLSAAISAITRTAGPNSEYATQSKEVIQKCSPYQIYLAVPNVGGALKALRHEVSSGYLVSVQELIHASLFADFLEMAEHLLGEGFKDPAAVLIGGVLEEHLRKLCNKNGIPTEAPDSKGRDRPKKAETMNSDLAGNGIYNKLDQKAVTAWLDLRNKAAHGRYHEYESQQIKLFLDSVRDFISRNPA
jgi:hypothetical protein